MKPALLVAAALLTVSVDASALTVPPREPIGTELSPSCDAFEACVCSVGGSCVDVCAATWCSYASPSDACFRCVVQDQTASANGCGAEFSTCVPSAC